MRARQLLDPLGIPLEAATAQFVEAKKLLGDSPLSQAVEFYVKRHPTKIPPRAASDVMEEMLACADKRLIAFLTLGAFAGIRHAEIQRLDWKDVHFDAGIIEIRAAKAKTASRRTLPILDNLRQWLAPYREASGPVCVYRNVASEIIRLVREINARREER